MWNKLAQHHDRYLVGTTMTLVTLALLACVRESTLRQQPVMASAAIGSSTAMVQVPRDQMDQKYFAARWRQIASEFYARHPVDPPISAITASLSERAGLSSDSTARATDSHAKVQGQPQPMAAIIASDLAEQSINRIDVLGLPAVAAALAAGVLASWTFALIWPTRTTPAVRAMECSNLLRIELPSHWVQVRPNAKERLKSVILLSSYLAATVASWTILAT